MLLERIVSAPSGSALSRGPGDLAWNMGIRILKPCNYDSDASLPLALVFSSYSHSTEVPGIPHHFFLDQTAYRVLREGKRKDVRKTERDESHSNYCPYLRQVVAQGSCEQRVQLSPQA